MTHTRSLLVAAALTFVVIGGPTLAQSYRGIVEIGNPFPSCSELCPGHVCTNGFFTDPCSGTQVGVGEFPIDLWNLSCLHVEFDTHNLCVDAWVVAVPQCTNEIRGLQVAGGADAVPSWERRPCAGSYDLIRGESPPAPVGGSLGNVTCLANDTPSSDPGTPAPITGPHDTEMPPEGHVFFYLVRANGAPYGENSYGRGSDGTERVPTAGDCPQ